MGAAGQRHSVTVLLAAKGGMVIGLGLRGISSVGRGLFERTAPDLFHFLHTGRGNASVTALRPKRKKRILLRSEATRSAFVSKPVQILLSHIRLQAAGSKHTAG